MAVAAPRALLAQSPLREMPRNLAWALAGTILLVSLFGAGRAALLWREDALQACRAAKGAKLERQLCWWEPGADGLLPAPPHDATGHSWQHSDAMLVRLVAEGPAVLAAPGCRSAMPAYPGRLPPSDIAAVVAYIKSAWPPGVRAYQATLNPGGPSLAGLARTYMGIFVSSGFGEIGCRHRLIPSL